MNKTCPACRVRSDYIVPSDVFCKHATPEKSTIITNYLTSMSRIPCRHFTQSSPESRYCPFGNNCHYAHKVNGEKYVFSHFELSRMRMRDRQATMRNRRRDDRREAFRNTEALLADILAADRNFDMSDEDHVVFDLFRALLTRGVGDATIDGAPVGRNDESDDDLIPEELQSDFLGLTMEDRNLMF
jgi:hypothetical protein